MTKTITEFFDSEYTDYASYDNYRKIANFSDGLKPSARKIMFTVMDSIASKTIKVDMLCARASERCQYLHGVNSLNGVTVGLAQSHTGTNNIPLLTRWGNFGNRNSHDAAAGRYIKTSLEEIAPYIYKKEDLPILIPQELEGYSIEPQFFMPIIPMILVNGAEGLTTGFAQKILPRDPLDIIKYITSRLKDKTPRTKLVPYYRGFTGRIDTYEEDNCWGTTGVLDFTNLTTIVISDIPPTFTLKSYIKVLDKLEEADIIKSYKDGSSGNIFKFTVKVARDFININSTEKIMSHFRISKKSTENFTCQNAEMNIHKFDSAADLIESYITLRLEYYQKRKDHILTTLKDDIIKAFSKYMFIKGVVEGTIIVSNRSVGDINAQLDANNSIHPVNGSYSYLLSIPISSLTKEQFEKLYKSITDMKTKYNDINIVNTHDMWLKELSELTTAYNKFSKKW